MKGSGNAASRETSNSELTVDDVIKIAEEEIRRTSHEAVKAAVIEIEGELAYEKERADPFEKGNRELEASNSHLETVNKQLETANIYFQEEAEKLKKKNRKGIILSSIIGGAGGALITSLVFSVCLSCSSLR